MKACISCGEMKSIDEYYIHTQMADGRLNKCKECVKSYARKNRELRINYYRAYDRDRGNRQDRSYLKEYRKNNSVKYAAHIAVNNAIRVGKLKKMPCEECLSERVHAHHDDYSNPLDIRWLCPAHHRQWHVENGEAKHA